MEWQLGARRCKRVHGVDRQGPTAQRKELQSPGINCHGKECEKEYIHIYI